MTADVAHPLREIAVRVANCLSERGYAFVEDDEIDTLADALHAFLTTAGIPLGPRHDG